MGEGCIVFIQNGGLRGGGGGDGGGGGGGWIVVTNHTLGLQTYTSADTGVICL